MSVTIKDIAQYLDLSVSTVSRALNGYLDVSPQTRARVYKASQDLGYYPSAAARNLRRSQTDKIGLPLVYSMTAIGEYVSKLITGSSAVAEESGYNLILYSTVANQLEQLTRICRAREVDGLLLIGPEESAETLDLLQGEAIPFVMLGRRATRADVSFIAPDNYGGATAIMQHLLDLGHRRIAYLTRPELRATSLDRQTAYTDALQNAGLPVEETLICDTSSADPQSGYDAAMQLFDLPEPPTAIFAIHDLVAHQVLRAASDRGLRVPEDVAVVGFDDLYSSVITNPPLTTVHQPLRRIGKRAMEVLLALIRDNTMPPVRETLPVDLIIRQSTASRL